MNIEEEVVLSWFIGFIVLDVVLFGRVFQFLSNLASLKLRKW